MKIYIHEALESKESGFLLNTNDWDEYYNEDYDGPVAYIRKWIDKICAKPEGSYIMSFESTNGEPVEKSWDHDLLLRVMSKHNLSNDSDDWNALFYLMYKAMDFSLAQCALASHLIKIGEDIGGVVAIADDEGLWVSTACDSVSEANKEAGTQIVNIEGDIPGWVAPYIDCEQLGNDDDRVSLIEYAGSFWAIIDDR